MKTYHFISGLPRSGTTLLSTILNQNPRFQASISGPLARFTRAIITESSSQGGYKYQCPTDKRKKIINGIFDNYYDDSKKEVIFDTNRGWPLLHSLINNLYPQSKMLMCVRDISKVLNSFETLQRKNPFTFTNIFTPEENINVYTRCEALLNPNKTLGFAYNCVKQGITGEHRSSIMIIEYENLAKHPTEIMSAIYNFINEPVFQHNFNDVEASYDKFDDDVQLSGLHTTRKKIEYIENEMIIPPDIINRVQGMEVWK